MRRRHVRGHPGAEPRLAVLAAVLAALTGGLSAPAAPPPDSSRLLSLRNLGLAQLEEGKSKDARATFAKLAELAPKEALPFANGAVAAIRENDFAGAEALLAKAEEAGGRRADVLSIRAALEEARGKADAMRAALVAAAAADPKALEPRWRFVRSVDSDPAPSPAAKEGRKKALAEIVAASPANLPARLRLLVLDLEDGAAEPARKNLDELAKLLADADAKTRTAIADAQALVEKGELKAASLKARVAENLQRVTSRYQQSLGELFTAVTGLPIETFSRELESALRPRPGAAIPVTFEESGSPAPDPDAALLTVDLANSGKPAPYALPAPYRAAAFLDFDLDGDLDVYLHAGKQPDRLLRNNLDGTWTEVTAATGDAAFESSRCVADDFDRDGDLDLLCVSAAGDVVLRSNLRQGRFQSLPLGVKGAVDVDAADLDADGVPDALAATRDGLVLLLGKGDGTFTRQAIDAAPERLARLADLDNDGFPDAVVSGEKGLAAFRNGGGTFTPWDALARGRGRPGEPPAEALLALDADGDGDLDLVVKRGGKARLFLNEGGNANGWLNVAVEGLATGSGKVNRAGVGSLVEVKAGDLYVARTVGLAPAHVGLGRRTKADVVRVVFTNGVPQNLLDQRARASVKEVQQLKGSCPFVYALDGASGTWSFVSDALGNAPLGLLYDGVHLAGAVPREWLLVDGSLLSPTPDGKLVLDYTEELWEVVFLDEATLMAVDHPEGTRVVPNERMVPEALPKKLFTASHPRPVRAAYSDATCGAKPCREDVTGLLARRDGAYVSPGPETYYQGFRGEHALELDLGPLGDGDRVVLFLDGWIFYTDTSINVSLSQRKDLSHFPPVLEVPDGHGGWKTALASLGFPAGKTKTMPVDLTGIVDPRDPRVRIRTTMAIFWDEAFVTVNEPAVDVRTTPLAPARATLFARGFSRRYRETPDGPHVFAHDDVAPGPLWQDVPGHVTRFGDVTPLLAKADDRWVAFAGGDAIRIAYDASALPPLAPGWRRDYVLVSDGWEKDFDRNTITGESVGPYPFHAMSAYPYPAGEAYPDAGFLDTWLTRDLGPGPFRSAVKDAATRP